MKADRFSVYRVRNSKRERVNNIFRTDDKIVFFGGFAVYFIFKYIKIILINTADIYCII